jgi:lipid II isoglutaminyl synthase (glutamine-hydrolysing)
MSKVKYYLTHLYPKEMSIYGDYGNIRALEYRLNQINVEVIYQLVNIGDPLPKNTNLYFFGGGQDAEQMLIYPDLLTKKSKLSQDLENGVGMLAICGGYQALGKNFITGDDQLIPGLGILPVITKAPDSSVKSRCIGNLIIEAGLNGHKTQLIGFENHGGQTFFVENDKKAVRPIGKVLLGYGNNSKQGMEGCIYKNIVGTYMHGPVLPKNPELADYLILKTLKLPNLKLLLADIDDTIALQAKNSLIQRFLTKS